MSKKERKIIIQKECCAKVSLIYLVIHLNDFVRNCYRIISNM